MSEQRTIHYFGADAYGRSPVQSLCGRVRVSDGETRPDKAGRYKSEATVSDEHAPNVCSECVADARDQRDRGAHVRLQPALVAP